MQCSCGADAKLNSTDTHYVCDACGRASKNTRGDSPTDLFVLLESDNLLRPRNAEHYRQLQDRIRELRANPKFEVVHESHIVDFILRNQE